MNMRLDQEIWPRQGQTPPRDVILEFVQDLQYRLLTRATRNLDKLIGKATEDIKPKVDEAAQALSAAAQAAYYARMAKHKG